MSDRKLLRVLFTVACLAFVRHHTSCVMFARCEPWPYPMDKSIVGDLLYLAGGESSQEELEFETVGWTSDVLENAFERYREILSDPTYHMEYEMNVEYPKELMDPSNMIRKVVVYVQTYDQTLDVYASESYSLTLSAPTVVIQAQTVYGAIHALETLSQSCHVLPYVEYDEGSGDGANKKHKKRHHRTSFHNVIVLNETAIYDAPRFRHRGLLLDTARHYLPPQLIKTHLDAMVMTKMNVLHWHMSDDESFPFRGEDAVVQELADGGAFSSRMVYTSDVVDDIVQYARLRGIRVIVEFDTPGHTGSISKSRPEVMVDCSRSTDQQGYPSISPVHEDTYDILWRLFRDASKRFPDRAMHFGGDEIDVQCWKEDERIQEWMSKQGCGDDISQVVKYYMGRIMEFAESLGKVPIVYNDLLARVTDDVLPPTTVVHLWDPIGENSSWQEELEKITRTHRAILSSPFYIDHASRGVDSWKDFWSVEPIQFSESAGIDQKDRVLGGEVAAWSERIDATNSISSTWPLAAAVGERLWSPATVTDKQDAERRMFRIRCRMLARGIQASPTMPKECPLIFDTNTKEDKYKSNFLYRITEQ